MEKIFQAENTGPKIGHGYLSRWAFFYPLKASTFWGRRSLKEVGGRL